MIFNIRLSIMFSLFAIQRARNTTCDLVHVHGLCKMLAEREEVGDTIHGQSKDCYYNCINHVSLCIVLELWFNELEDHYHHALPYVEQRKWSVVVIKFETQDLLAMGVYSAVLEAPEETHKPCQYIPLLSNDVAECDSAHDCNNGEIDEGTKFAANFINEESNEECSQNFAKSE